MIRHLTKLVLATVLGSIVLVGNAEACHKRKCGCAAPAPAPCATAYAKPVPPPPPAPCAPVATTSCAPKVKHCSFKLPQLFHKKACAAPVACAPAPCGAPAPVSYAYTATFTVPAPSAQH